MPLVLDLCRHSVCVWAERLRENVHHVRQQEDSRDHFPGYEWHLWLHWKGQFWIISQAMSDFIDFIKKVSSASFPKLWMTSLTSLKRSILDHFPGYEWRLWLHWKGQFWIISLAMSDVFDVIKKNQFCIICQVLKYEWHLWLRWKGKFCLISQASGWHLWLQWKGQFWIISQAMSDVFLFIEKVNCASFPFCWKN